MTANLLKTISALVTAMTLVTQPTLEDDLLKMHATAYCLPGKTYTGAEVQEGICASGNKDLINKVVILYQRLPDGNIGEMIGIYTVQDTGCKDTVIDVWMPDLNACQGFMDRVYEDGCKGKIYVKVLEQ